MLIDEWVILDATALMHSVTAMMNLATLHRTVQARFLHWEHHATMTGLIQGNDTPTHEGTDHTPPTMGTDKGDISTNHNHVAITTTTGTTAVLEYTHCTPHPATTVVHATFGQWMSPLSLT